LTLQDSAVTAGGTTVGAVVQSDGSSLPADARITWIASTPAVAAVDSLGRIIAVGEGTTTITARVGTVSSSRQLEVRGVRAIALGDGGNWALRTDGKIFCWGGPGVADGIGMGKLKPFEIAAPVAFGSLAVGRTHACAISVANDAYCWGTSSFGELGVGAGAIGLTVPTKVVGDRKYKAVAVGQFLSCALEVTGAPYCWGSSVDGLSTARIVVPTAVPSAGQYDRIAATFYNVCASTDGGQTACWGDVVRPLSGASVTGAVSGAGQWFCSPTPSGDAACWTWGPVVVNTLQPAAIVMSGLGLKYVAPSFDGRSFCGLRADDSAVCWGANEGGQLGTGVVGASDEPESPKDVAGQLHFRTIALQRKFACGVTTVGRLYCWGNNRLGEFGDGTRTSSASPVAISIP
jgi:alpha-tubulin suppressor-like RCC1 family protein